MKLLLDIGNTRIKWAFAEGDGLIEGGSVVHRDADTQAALAFIRCAYFL